MLVILSVSMMMSFEMFSGLIISFCLNVTLIFKRSFNYERLPGTHQVNYKPDDVLPFSNCAALKHCEPGSFYSCDQDRCVLCPRGTYQPHVSQVSCWPCPDSTTTDTTGARDSGQCKHLSCSRHETSDESSRMYPLATSRFYPD